MASTPFTPPAWWLSGTNQNSIPANDNALRFWISQADVDNATTAQPASPAEGQCHIIQSTHTGAQWSAFTPNDLAIFSGGTWYAFAPVEGNKVTVSGVIYVFSSGAWAAAVGGMSNPMSAAGDLIYGGTPSGGVATPTRLPPGTNGYVLTLAAGLPTWAAATGGFSNPMTTSGDLILGGTSGAPGRLPIGANGTVLTVTAGVVGWQAATAGFTNPMTALGDIIVGGASGAPTALPAGTNGYVLTLVAGAPAWVVSGGGSFTGGALSSALDEAKGADIARAATTNIGAATGNLVHLTGTATITGLGTVQAGTRRIVRFAGAGTLTHNATSLILPGAANITTAANDCAIFVSEGSGNWRCVAYSRANGTAIVASTPASLTNVTGSVSTASPNNTVNAVRLLANAGSTNADLVIQPKGTGALLAQLPDSSATGGDKRGDGAVDLQMTRAASTQVAAGAYSAIPGGRDNTASGTDSFCSGRGGLANGPYSSTSGFESSARFVHGAKAFASGRIVNAFDSQTREFVLRGESSGAGSLRLTTNMDVAGNSNQANFPESPGTWTMGFEITVVAKEVTTNDSKVWKVTGAMKSVGYAVSMLGTPTLTVIGADTGASSWSVAVSADAIFACLGVTATGAASTAIRWCAYMRTTEVTA